MSDALSANPVFSALGYALLAFLWQGAAIGSLTAVALAVSRRARATVRYAMACAGLALLAVAPVVSGLHFATSRPVSVVTAPTEVAPLAGVVPLQTEAATEPTPAALPARFTPLFERNLAFMVLFWASGVGLGALRLLAGWWRLRRLCRAAVIVSPSGWPESLRRMAERLVLTKRIEIVTSSLVEIPAIVGWIRPAIVVPAALLANLPASYLDAVLAHELAHLRRRDYFVNALQCAVEVVLFYHPAVWWVSRQVRVEREHCCDDEAVELCGDRLEYARAIASLEELRTERVQLALAAGGGHLLTRVRRLVEPSFVSGPRMSGGMMMVFTLSALLLYSGLQIGAADRVEALPSAPEPAPTVVASPVVVTLLPSPPAAQSSSANASERRSAARTPPAQVAAPQASQLATGSIAGRVSDPSGGVVPGVNVSVSSPVMPAARSLVTNARGEFAIVDLVPGTYELTVSITGFKTARLQNVSVLAGRRSSVGFRLELGSLTETVTIVGAASGTPRPSGVAPSAPTGVPEAPIRVGGDIREPKRVRDVKPAYPAAALAAGIEGTVVIEAVLTQSGTVSSARVVRGVPELDQAALDAVSEWLYTPTMLNGQPVSVLVMVTMTFIAR